MRFLLILAVLSVVSLPSLARTQICGSAFVELSNGTITISPTGDDDTNNLQCAFDEAVSNGYPIISLTAGDFSIYSDIVVNQFTGKFTGAGLNRTLINAKGSSGRLAHIKLIASNVEISLMALTAQPTGEDAILHITRPDNCEQRVTRTVIDRVKIEYVFEDGSAYKRNDGRYINALNNCDDPTLGYLSVNRSEFRGGGNGIWFYGYGGGAKMEFTNNVFWGGVALNGYGLSEDEPLNITLSFTGNRVTAVTRATGNSPIVGILFEWFSVKSSSLHFARNTFTQAESVNGIEERGANLPPMLTVKHGGGYGQKPYPDDKYDVALTIVGNTFNREYWHREEELNSIDSHRFEILETRWIDNGVVSGNRFICNNGQILSIEGNNWAVSGNKFQRCRNVGIGEGSLYIEGDNNVVGGNTF